MDYSFAAKLMNINQTQDTNHMHTSFDLQSKIYYNLNDNLNSTFDPFPSLFDSPDKMDSKQYHLFKKISPIKPLSLDLKNKLFEDTVSAMKDISYDDVNPISEQRIFHIYAHKNYKARLVLIDNGGPKNYLNLNNFRFYPFKYVKDEFEKGKTGFFLEKNNKKIGYYTCSQEMNELWLSFLRNYCILKSFIFEYELLNPFREENFCKIYRAHRKNQIFHEFCVKIYNSNNYKDYDEVQKVIINEITILRQTHHESIISLLEVHEFRGIIYLVLEPFHSESLNSIMKQKIELSDLEKFKIIEHILKALKYLHCEGIIHRGINPSNILFRSNKSYNDVVIADFSLAVYYNKDNVFNFRKCGIPGYLAPEIIFGLRYDYKIDIFSAAAVFYYIIMCEPLCNGNSIRDILKQNYEFKGIENENYEDKLDNVNTCWRELLEKTLRRLPKDRITAMEALDLGLFKKDNKENQIYMKIEKYESFATIPNEGISQRHQLKLF